MSQFWPSCISGTSHAPCREVLSALLPVCSAITSLHIWHKSRTLPGSSICTHLAGKFHLHCCLFAPPLPDPLPIRTSPAPPASSLLLSFSSFLVFRLVHQSKSQVSSQVRSRLPNQLGSSSALPLPRHIAQARKAAKEEEEEQKKEEKEKKKEEAVQQHLKKQSEKEEQQTARETARQQAREEKAEKQAEKMANKEAKKWAEEEKEVQQVARSARNPSQTTKEMPAADDGEDEGWEDDEVPRTTSHGHVLRKPSRFVQ